MFIGKISKTCNEFYFIINDRKYAVDNLYMNKYTSFLPIFIMSKNNKFT